MTEMPTARITRHSYENVTTVCPICARECVLNRCSDLNTFKPILGREVSCPHAQCRRRFWITGDGVNNAFETLIFDCYELLAQKHYMNCVLSAAQAYEMFFALFFRVELAYRPYAAEQRHQLDALNGILRRLLEETRRHTFPVMRCLFLRHFVDGRAPKSLAAAEDMAANLGRPPGELPEESEIGRLDDAELARHLLRVRSTPIVALRNKVVHKEGYRPSASKAEACIEEARQTLPPLARRLDLRDDVNHYAMRKHFQ